MRYINNREQFITDWRKKYTEDSKSTNEAFDMSGGSGPMGNDINWGDSLVGRMFNSIFRKIGVQQDLRSINNVIKAIQKEFESIKIESKTSGVDKAKISRLHVSYLLEALTNAVHSGTKVIIIKSIAEETIDIVDESELPEDDKLEAIEELEAFLKFLEQYDDEVGEDLSDELTGIDSSEEEKAESISTSGWGENTYSGMRNMMVNLIKVIENKDNVSTTAQGEKEDITEAKNINYVLNEILKEINQNRDQKFENDLLSGSKDIKWPILEISGNKIIYRKNKNLVELKSPKELMVNVPKWSDPEKGGSGWQGDSKPSLEDFNKKTIKRIANYIVSQLKDINSVINSDKDFKLNENEIKWFNENIKGKWGIMLSNNNRYYKSEIGDCNSESQVEFLTPPVKGQARSNVNNILRRGVFIYKDKKDADSHYQKLYDDGKLVLSKKGKSHGKDPESKPKTGVHNKNKKKFTVIGEKDDKLIIKYEGDDKEYTVSRSEVKLNESYEFLLEKSRLSKEETDANQALSRLKLFLDELITEKSKSPAIDLKFLTSIKDKGSKSFMNTFGAEIKSKYNQISEGIQKTPLYKSVNENIEMVDDTLLSGPREKQKAKGDRDSAAEKIARFASVSMLFIGEGLYSELGELGKALEKFNNEFQKLLNTEFKKAVEKTEEKRVFSYSDFMSINEKKTEKEISEEIKTYYDENVSYEKWKVTKEEVKEVDEQIKKTKSSNIPHESIIRIVKLFNKAHKIHTKEVIPSGRKSGKVSNRVFREYEYVGDSGSGGPSQAEDGGIKPGIGPYRNKKVFNKFESAILDIIGDSKYKDFFSDEVKVTTTNRDGKTETETKKVKGSGKILLKFINDLLDGNKLYKGGAQSKFFQEYFGFKVDPKELGGLPEPGSGTETGSDSGTGTDEKVSVTFKDIDKIDLTEIKTFYLFKDGKSGNTMAMFIVTNGYSLGDGNDDYTYFKISESAYHFRKCWEKEAELETTNESEKGKDILFGRIKKNEEIKNGSDIDLEYISLEDFKTDQSRVSKKTKKIKFSNIKVLKKKDSDEIFKLKGNTTSGESPDTSKYKGDLVQKLK